MNPNYPWRPATLAALFFMGVALTGCSNLPKEANELLRQGKHDQAVALLQGGVQQSPQDRSLRLALENAKEDSLNYWTNQAERELQAGRGEAASQWLERAAAVGLQSQRVAQLRRRLESFNAQDAWLLEAQQAFDKGQWAQADKAVNAVLAQAPNNATARQIKRKLRDMAESKAATTLGAAYQKPVNLEFREAAFRTVMDALAQSTGVSFVFDQDVKSDTKLTVQLKGVTVDEALKIILATQRLERKVLSESTLLIYPDTSDKRRQYQDFAVRTFYLANANVTQVQNLVRSIAKTKDLYVDERLNLMVVRDTPEVIKLVERLVEAADLAEPEVMLEVEILEISSSTLNTVGIQWPGSISYGLAGTATQITEGAKGLTYSISNPGAVATLKASASDINTLANPRLRVRNREKAKVMIGDKLPVFTTTSGLNTGVATSVSYLDVGLKLDVEPTVMLDSDVLLKIGLEVSSVTGKVDNGQGTTAYQIGSRQAASTLRLQDGETQILAGLMRDEDTKTISGLPGLSKLPGLGRLFGVHADGVAKTELVLLITPRVIRNITLPDANATNGPAGNENNTGAEPLVMNPKASAKVPLNSTPLNSAPGRSGATDSFGSRSLGGRDMRQAPPAQSFFPPPSTAPAPAPADFPSSFSTGTTPRPNPPAPTSLTSPPAPVTPGTATPSTTTP
jgi:general secretion pathway protein D